MNRNFPDEQRWEGHSRQGDSGSLTWPEHGVWIGCGGGRSVLKKVACDQDVVGSGS